MKDGERQIKDFLEKCGQLRRCKFIMATTHIKEVLTAIAASETLYGLFAEVTKDFDYISAKRSCLSVSGEGFAQRWKVVLPAQPADRLAFVFCLLAEFDRGTMNLNDFLQRYFPEDGSYSSSFRSFCNAVIAPFEEIVRQLAEDDEDVSAEAVQNAADPERARDITAFSLILARERDVISASAMSASDKGDGLAMLDGLEDALKGGRTGAAEAILRGYDYYSACHGGFSRLTEQLAALRGNGNG